jgi:hypothetical protein
MDPNVLVDQVSVGVPAPFWFVQFFKALGFALHAVPMNLWYAGLLVALWLHVRGSDQARHFASRLLQQMPVIIAFGVNLGIVPLLFVQLAYYKVFYPATILMAWFWLAIIVLLIPAYYGVYIYALGLRNEPQFVSRFRDETKPSPPFRNSLTGWKFVAGWLSALLFLAIGFLFANGLSLMDHVERWPELWKSSGEAGTAWGTALNVGDPTLWPRWLLMFGLALCTTAAWLVFDAAWLARKSRDCPNFRQSENGTVPLAASNTADEAYEKWAWSFGRKLYTFGMMWFAAAGSWYVFGTWSETLRTQMFESPLLALTIATAVVPGLPWLLMMTAGLCQEKRATAAAVAFCQFAVLGVNATSRQIVQNINLKPFLDVSSQPTEVQWGPLYMFLIAFVIGLGIIGWMLAQLRKCKTIY